MIRLLAVPLALLFSVGPAHGEEADGTLAQARQQIHARKYGEALPLLTKLKELQPKSAEVAFELACALGGQGQVAAAQAELKRAFDLGLSSVQEVLTHPALAALHETPAFRDLICTKPLVGSITLTMADEPGTKMRLKGRVVDEAGRPLAGARLFIYHTDATGVYSRRAASGAEVSRIFGCMLTGKDGTFTVSSIRPAAYPNAENDAGRVSSPPQHVHIVIRAKGYPKRETEVLFDDDPKLTPQFRRMAARAGFVIVKMTKPDGGPEEGELEIKLKK